MAHIRVIRGFELRERMGTVSLEGLGRGSVTAGGS